MALYSNSAFYPHYATHDLREVSGSEWAELVDYISRLPRNDERVIAMTMMVRRLRRSMELDGSLCRDPFSALDATTVLSFYRGSERDLLETYYSTLHDVQEAASRMRFRSRKAVAVPA